MLASQGGHTNVVEVLLQHGAIVDMQEAVSTGSTVIPPKWSVSSHAYIYIL